MVEKILNNTTTYGKIRASHEGLLHSSTLSACPHRQFHTLPGLLDSRAALSNSYPNALRAMQGGSLYHFYDGLWYDPAGR